MVIMIAVVTGEMVLWKGMSRGHFSPFAGQDTDATRHPATASALGDSCCGPAPGPLLRGLCIVTIAVESYETAASVTVADLATMVLSETGGL